jgi:MFS family permease
LFRAVWLASVASNVGTWMQDVGSTWLMTSLSRSAILVSLMQTASSLPFFLLALPSGALADVVDRRRLLIFTQSWMMGVAALLGLLTLAGLVTPGVLLGLTFTLGLGAALNGPAWQATMPELVPREELPAAVALNGVGFNLARAVGPALGGLVVAAAGPGAVFLLNAASFLGVILVLRRWQRAPRENLLPAERVISAMRAGFRYVRHEPGLQAVLFRAGTFILCGSALWALLPLVARRQLGLDSLGYGALLGCLGVGAVGGATLLPRWRQRLGPDPLMALTILLLAGSMVGIALLRSFLLVGAVMVAAGVAWMAIMSSFNVVAQMSVPEWVQARALAVYLLVAQGGMAVGGALWGFVAARAGIPAALICASVGLVIGLAVLFRYRLPLNEGTDYRPSHHWADPQVQTAPGPEDGPVLVIVEYRINPSLAVPFACAMQALRRIRLRDGASQWGLFADLADPARQVETFVIESWAEHLRQHERVTVADRAIEERVFSFHLGPEPPAVTHLIYNRPADCGGFR